MIKTLNFKKTVTSLILVFSVGIFQSQVTSTTPPTGYEPAPNTSGNSLVVNGKFATTGGATGGGVVATSNPATTVGGQNSTSNMWSQAYHCTDSPNGTIRAEDSCPGFSTENANFARNKYNLMGGTWPNSTAKQLNIIPFPGDPSLNVNPSNTYLYSNGNAFGEGYLAKRGSSGDQPWAVPEYLIWQNTITGLQVGRYYTFYAYVKNALDGTAGANAPAYPRTRLRTGGTDGLPDGTEHAYIELLNLTAADKASALKGWKRISVTFQATKSSEKFKVTSAAQGIDGDDFQMTAVEVVPYVPALTATATSTNLCVGNTLNLQATSPITSDVTYAWTGPNGFTSTQQNPTRVNLSAADFGTYTVTLTDQYGITNIKSIDITQATTGCNTVQARNDGYNTPSVTNTNGGVVGVVTVNDMINQQLITSPTTQVNITLTNNGGMNGATLNASGNLTIPAGTPAGVYILTYQICNKAIPTDCSTATITVEVYLDSDGDGYADVVDLDDDNDGILDTDEATACSAFTPFFVENFGTGGRTTTNYTNYTYMATPWDFNTSTGGQLNDGFYAIINSIGDTASWAPCAWMNLTQDHTPGDTNGRMAFFNATYNPSEEFYNRSGITVPANTPVRLSFWALNVDAIKNTCDEGNFNRILPNVRVLIKTNDGTTLIKAFSTGNIARDEQWHQYSFDFNPGNNTQIRFILMNDSEGGNGNDIAIDDIHIVRVCDTDGDGIPNDLDLDSDGDGCSDAIEGDEKLRSDHLLANGAINTAANGGVGNLPSNLGVPNIVNSGTFDIGNDVGQGPGSAYDKTINPCLMDALDDDFSANCVSSITGGTAGDVSANDLMYGLPVNDAWMTFTVTNNGGMTGVSLDANGNLIVPAGTPEGTYTITYQICKNNCDTAQVIVKVCRIYAVNDINQTQQGVSVNGNVITNDDSTNGALTVQSATYYNSSGVLTDLPLSTATTIYIPGGTTAAGTMTLNSNGTYTFVPAATFVGEVPVNYVASNGNGLSDAAILTIQVIPATNSSTNDKPIAQDDTSFTEAGVAVTNNALANDSDPDGNTLTITAAKQGTNTITIGTSFTVAGTNPAGVAVPNAGTITINQNGSYTYTPAAGFVGDVNPINYTISDGNSGTDTANIYITVKPNVGNTTFANDDANSAPKGIAMNGNVLTNDTDPEGDSPSVTGGVFFGGSNTTGVTLTLGTASPISGVGSVTLNGDGTYKFTPEANFVGTAEVIYTKCDNGSPQACDKATLYLTSLGVFDLQICSDPNVIYSVGTNGITPVNVSTATTGTPFAVPPAGVGPNALGYSVVSKKFYYFESSNNPLTFVSFDPLTNVKTVLPSPYPLPHPGSTVPRGVVTSDGTGYYLLNEGVELYYYNIAANTWTLITNKLVDQNGNVVNVIKDKEVSGDIAIDGQNNLWILSSAYGTNPSGATHSLFKISAPLPTTSVASLSTALLLSSAPNANSETFTGIAFNASGQIYLGTPNRIYLLNNDFTITQLANVSGASDLASCSLPLTAFPQDISGNVYNDANGLGGTPANTIDGVGTNLGGTLNAVLIDRNNGKVVATVPVNANGTYSFPQTSAGIYTIQITTATATVGSNPPAVTLPAGWSNLGEKLGTGPGTDGTPDGKLNVDVSGAPVNNANFGVRGVIDAVDDYYNNFNVSNTLGGTVGVITANDTLIGAAITSPSTQVNITLNSNGGIAGATIDANGNVNIPAGTAPGNYVLNYTICDKANPTNCDSANIYIQVFLDSDGDGYSDEIDLDSDNDGIKDILEDCNSFNIQMTNGVWRGKTSSNFTATVSSTAYNSGWTSSSYSTLKNKFIINTPAVNADPLKSIRNNTMHTVTYNFSTPVPANEIGIFVADIDGDQATTTHFKVQINGGTPINHFAQQPLVGNPNGAPAANYNPLTGDIVVNPTSPTAKDQFALLKGFGTQMVSSITIQNLDNNLDYTDFGIFSYVPCDLDGDGIPNILDLDSDGDGCTDAIEGANNITVSQLVTAGGNLTTQVPNQNLCNSASCVGTTAGTNLGVPTVVGNGQGLGTSQNAAVSECFIEAIDDVNQTPQNVPVSGSVITNDNAATAITVQSAQFYNASGTLTNLPVGTATTIYSNGVAAGSMLLNANGTYTFTPTATFVGSVPIVYTARNTSGSTDSATLEIQVIPPANSVQNDNPVAINDVSRTEMNTPVSGNALANDSDPDGNTLTVSGISFGGTSVTPGTAFTVSGVNAAGATVSNAGSVTLNPNGTYTYTPATGFVGTVNPITYTANDGNGGTDTAFIYLTVNPELGNTTYANDDANSAPKGTTMNGNVTTNDSDPENNQTTVTAGTFNGTTLTIGQPTTITGVGTVTLDANGIYTYVPDPSFVGTAQVVYTKCDNGTPQACDTATLYLTTIDTVAGYCYKFPTTNTGVNVPTKHGITALSRAGEANGNWPMVRQSSWTTLEAKNKGFVVNRVEFDTTGKPVGISTANYVEGMMVYDTTNNCLKIYNGTIWSCYSTPACP